MSDGYGSTQSTNVWIGSDGTVTNHDPDTEMGFWIRLFHNECDRSAHLEQEIECLREQNGYLKANIEMLLSEARQAKYGIEDMYD